MWVADLSDAENLKNSAKYAIFYSYGLDEYLGGICNEIISDRLWRCGYRSHPQML